MYARAFVSNDLSVLPTMNTAVEGRALKLADAADKGGMAAAASYMSDIMTGCVACHQKFRGVPGISANLISKPDSKQAALDKYWGKVVAGD